MTHLLDTDILSVWQNGTGPDYAIFILRMSAYPLSNVVTSIVSFHEQVIGAHAYLNNPRNSVALVNGYQRLERIRDWFTRLNVMPFDGPAATEFDNLRALNLRVGTMDLRIAAIALSSNLTVVTRNTSDFSRVPGLRIEDWTR